MRVLTDFFKINGSALYAPDNDMQMQYTDLDSSESGRDDKGYMHRVVLRSKVGTWSFEYTQLTDAEYTYLCNLLDSAGATFSFTHPPRGAGSGAETTTCYCSNYGICWRDARQGIWRNFKFNIIEC